MARVHGHLLWLMGLVCTFSFCLMMVIMQITSNDGDQLTREHCQQSGMSGTFLKGVPLQGAPAVDAVVRKKRRTEEEITKTEDIDKLSDKKEENVDTFKADSFKNPATKTTNKPKPKNPGSLLTGSSNVGDAYREYIKLRPKRVDPTEIKFLISGDKICLRKHPVFLIILCVSEYFDSEKRNIIRQTWGSMAKTGTWPLVKATAHVKLVFVLSNPGNSVVKKAIVKEENDKFGDLVLVDIEESLNSQSKRLMAGLKWVSTHCSQAKFLLRVDQQTVVHVPNLIAYLKPFKVQSRGHIIGSVYSGTKVLRGGKWALNQSIYPFDVYPPYVNGASYVISGNIVEKLLNAAIHLPYIFIEDVFITGLAREAIGAELKHRSEFGHVFGPRSGRCVLHETGLVSVMHVKTGMQLEIWEALHQEVCKEEIIDKH